MTADEFNVRFPVGSRVIVVGRPATVSDPAEALDAGGGDWSVWLGVRIGGVRTLVSLTQSNQRRGRRSASVDRPGL